MHNKVVSAVFTILGLALAMYSVILVLDDNFYERCITVDNSTSCKGGMTTAGPFALVAIALMIAAVATRPTSSSRPKADSNGPSQTYNAAPYTPGPYNPPQQ